MARKSIPDPETRRKRLAKSGIFHISKEGIFDSVEKSSEGIFDFRGTVAGSQLQPQTQKVEQLPQPQKSPMAVLKQMVQNRAPVNQEQGQSLSQAPLPPPPPPPPQTLTTRLYLQNKTLARQNSNLNSKMAALEAQMSELISENICLRQKNLELQRCHDGWLRSHVNQTIRKQLQQHVNGITQLMQGLIGNDTEEIGGSAGMSRESVFHDSLSFRSLSITPNSRATLSGGSPKSSRNSLSRGSATRQTMGPADFGRRRSSRRRSSFFSDIPLLRSSEDVLDPSAQQLHLEAQDVVTPMVDDVEGWGEVPRNEEVEYQEMEHMEEEGEEGEEEEEEEGMEMEHETMDRNELDRNEVDRNEMDRNEMEKTKDAEEPEEKENAKRLVEAMEKRSINHISDIHSPSHESSFPSLIQESSFPSPFSSSFRRISFNPGSAGEPMEEASMVEDSAKAPFSFIQQRSRPNSSSRPSSRAQIHVFADPPSGSTSPVVAASPETPPRTRPSLFDTPESTKARQELERKRRESMEQLDEQPESPSSRASSRRQSRRISDTMAGAPEASIRPQDKPKDIIIGDGLKPNFQVVDEPETFSQTVDMNELRRLMDAPGETQPNSRPKSSGRKKEQRRVTRKAAGIKEGSENEFNVMGSTLEVPRIETKSIANDNSASQAIRQSAGEVKIVGRATRPPTATGGVKVTSSKKSTKSAKPSHISPLMEKNANGSGEGNAKVKILGKSAGSVQKKKVTPEKQAIKERVIDPPPRARRSRGAPVNYKLPSTRTKMRRENDCMVDAVGGLKRGLVVHDENEPKRRRI